ncbi:MAG: hypothetical protein GF350_04585 [Chitinivibrionales bacterium]|nr:hypothetical protein [Chitinivibrionales bacterium]
MKKNLLLLLLLNVMAALFMPRAVQAQESIPADSQSILIAHAKSGLEYNVAELIKKEYQTRGYRIRISDIALVHKQEIDTYSVVILFSAVRENELNRSSRKLMQTLAGKDREDRPVLFISTIAGENRLEKKNTVDAVSAASDMISAQPVAGKIIGRIDRLLEQKTEEVEQ